jgi:DDE superfamily endonuclease
VPAKAIRTAGAKFFFLPKYSPDLNPIEKVFAKLKQWLRKAARRTDGAVCNAIAEILPLTSPDECSSYFAQAGYSSDLQDVGIDRDRGEDQAMDTAPVKGLFLAPSLVAPVDKGVENTRRRGSFRAMEPPKRREPPSNRAKPIPKIGLWRERVQCSAHDDARFAREMPSARNSLLDGDRISGNSR